jgi:hypothetical protein
MVDLQTILTNMEKTRISETFFMPDCVEPGFDNTNTPLDRVLVKIKK